MMDRKNVGRLHQNVLAFGRLHTLPYSNTSIIYIWSSDYESIIQIFYKKYCLYINRPININFVYIYVVFGKISCWNEITLHFES